MKVSQQLIADRLRLSTATVSKSLRNSSEIHPETRAQVIQLASELGYRSAVRRLDKSVESLPESLSICLLLQSDSRIGSNETPHANNVLAGLSEAAHSANASIVVHYVGLKDRDRIIEPACQPVAMREGMLSGLVLQHYYPSHIVKELSQRWPCVGISRHCSDVNIDCVDLDASQAMAVIIRKLLQLGHRRIGFLGAQGDALASLNDQAWHQERFSAYVQAMTWNGCAFDPSVAYPTRFNATYGHQSPEDACIDRVVSQSRAGVTAWVTGSDAIGTWWSRALMARGLRIPQDISITGVDAVDRYTGGPLLTSIRVPFAAMGRAAVKLLVERIHEPASPIKRVTFEGQFVEGETVGPAAS